MNIQEFKQKNIEKYVYAALMLAGMFLAAHFTGHKEIIFPEIFAIITGCWIAAKTPWNTNKYQIIGLSSIAALGGVLTVRYMPIPMYGKILFCFLLTELLMTFFKTNFVPIIPSGIFPIFMNVHSFVYPVAVFIMTSIIILGEQLLIKHGRKTETKYCSKMFNITAEIKHYSKLFITFATVLTVPIFSGRIFLMSPPVVAAFAELANPMSMNRKRAAKIWGLLVITSIIGTFFRYVFNILIPLPLIIAALVAATVYFVYCNKADIIYPPASGVLLMPMILKPAEVLWYPLEVAVGMAVLIWIDLHLFPSATQPSPVNKLPTDEQTEVKL